MKKQVDYNCKTATAYLQDLPEELYQGIKEASMRMALLWNHAIDFCEAELAKGDEGEFISAFTLNNWLTRIRNGGDLLLQFPENDALHQLSPEEDLPTDMSREVLKMLAGSYTSYFKLVRKKDLKARPPGKKKFGWFQTLAWSSFSQKEKDGVKYLVVTVGKGKKLWLPLDRYVLGEIEREVKGKELKHVKLSKNRHEPGFQLDVAYAYDRPELPEHPRIVRAIDLGAGDTAICDSTGHASLIPMRRPDKYWTDKLASVSSRADKLSVRHSRSWKRRMKARRKMANISSNQLLSFQKKLAFALLDARRQSDGTIKRGDVEAVIVGEAKVRMGLAKSTGTPDQHRGAQNTGYLDRLSTLIKHKCQELGIHFLEIPDPKRQGDLRDPKMKLGSAKALLREGCEKLGIAVPEGEFVIREFVVPQGKGQPPKRKEAA